MKDLLKHILGKNKMVLSLESMNDEEKFALLCGIIMGDGCLSLVNGKKKFIAITGSSIDDISFFQEIVSPLLVYFREKNTNLKFRKDCNAIEFNFIDAELFDLISSSGFPVGKKGANLKIPKLFYEKNLLKHVVQGFFATDGSFVLTKNPNKYYPRIESRTIHKQLIKEIHDYLQSLGMSGNHYFCKSRPDPRWNVVQDQYRFQFNGKKNLLLFEKEIGFVNLKHHKKFLDFMNYDREYNQSIKGVPSSNHKPIREPINLRFERLMAPPGTEPGTSSS